MPQSLSSRSAVAPSTALFLYVARRMAANGPDDAQAALAMLAAFGKHHRRPLLLMRAMMHELASAAVHRITVAPCCCRRMTRDEARLLVILAEAEIHPREAHDGLAELTGSDHCLGALTSVQAVGQAFADLGHPIRLFAG